MNHFTASDGLRLSYEVDDHTDPWKPKETLILLHAVLGSSRRFYQWIPVLSRHIRVVRLDMRGLLLAGIVMNPERYAVIDAGTNSIKFHIAESFFELFKSHKALARKDEELIDTKL